MRGAYSVQKRWDFTRAIPEVTTMGFEFSRNLSSLLPVRLPFRSFDAGFQSSMKLMYSYGAGIEATAVRISNDIVIFRSFNQYSIGKQTSETVAWMSDSHIVFYGASKMAKQDVDELIKNRKVIMVLQFEYHHKWLTDFMELAPEAIITGCETAYWRHRNQMWDGSEKYPFTPVKDVCLPQELFITKVEGVSDEEYMLLEKSHRMLFSSHFIANPEHFAGIISQYWFIRMILQVTLATSKIVCGWDHLPTDNPVLDRQANNRTKAVIEAQGGYSRVHGSHAGMIVYPHFEGLDQNHDGQLSTKSRSLSAFSQDELELLDSNHDGRITLKDFEKVYKLTSADDLMHLK